jgi:hypothetical protein
MLSGAVADVFTPPGVGAELWPPLSVVEQAERLAAPSRATAAVRRILRIAFVSRCGGKIAVAGSNHGRQGLFPPPRNDLS